MSEIIASIVYECNCHSIFVQRTYTLTYEIAEKKPWISKEKKGDRNEVWYSINWYKTLSAWILIPRNAITPEFMETDRKRNLYILIEIGKQFVSLFEIHEAGKCAYVHQSVVISFKHLPFCTRVQRIATSLIERVPGRMFELLFPNLTEVYKNNYLSRTEGITLNNNLI